MQVCSVCNDGVTNEEPETTATGICRNCRERLAVTPMGNARRPPVPCQRCNGMRFVRALARDYSGEWDRPAPMVVTTEVNVREGMLGGIKADRMPRETGGLGKLELYICRACGFVEWYCDNPATLPIGPQYMTEAIDYDSDAPYR
jgi:hypothetical protein